MEPQSSKSRKFTKFPLVSPSIMIVGDNPTVEDEKMGMPYTGGGGNCLIKCLNDAGLRLSDCARTYVFHTRPFNSDLKNFCLPKKEIEEYARSKCGLASYPYPLFQTGHYFKPDELHVLDALKKEIQNVRPNIVIALGQGAAWALAGSSNIGKIRGTVFESKLVPGQKMLVSHSPSQVLRNWALRPILMADIIKTRLESAFPEIRVLKRKIAIAESIQDIEDYYKQYLKNAKTLSIDIETMGNQFISCIGFAPDHLSTLVIPFIRQRGKTRFAFWESQRDELEAWKLVKRICENSAVKLGQNFVYDFQYLRSLQISCRNYCEDTMLIHHSLFLEMPKSLGFQGSIYCNETSWKEFRPKGKGADKKEVQD